MGWSTVPVTAGTSFVLKAQFDEVRTAIIERSTAVGLSLNPTAVTANGDQAAAILSNYRTHIETLIPYFANPSSSYAAYSKATCLTAALSKVDWYTRPDTSMYNDEINELRLVLNQLQWGRLTPAYTTSEYWWSYPASSGTDTSWAAAWNLATTAYGAASAVSGATDCGFFTQSNTGGSGPPPNYAYYKDIYRSKITDMSFAIADIVVLDTKFRVYEQGLGDTGQVDFYPTSSFAGTATAINITSGETAFSVLDVATVTKNTTKHYSLVNNPSGPAIGSYYPADVDLSKRGWLVTPQELLVQFQFEYRT